MSIKWLFFDLGDTIYDETLSNRQRADDLLCKSSVKVSYDAFLSEMKKAAMAYAESPFASARKSLSIAEDVPYSNEREVLFPDALKVISQLSEKYKLGIIANQPQNTRERLIADGLDGYFDVSLLSDCEDLYKPDLRFFEYALSKAGIKGSEAVMIGDRLDNDIYPAKKLGMTTVRIRQGLSVVQTPKTSEYAPDYEIDKLSELLDIEF